MTFACGARLDEVHTTSGGCCPIAHNGAPLSSLAPERTHVTMSVHRTVGLFTHPRASHRSRWFCRNVSGGRSSRYCISTLSHRVRAQLSSGQGTATHLPAIIERGWPGIGVPHGLMPLTVQLSCPPVRVQGYNCDDWFCLKPTIYAEPRVRVAFESQRPYAHDQNSAQEEDEEIWTRRWVCPSGELRMRPRRSR